MSTETTGIESMRYDFLPIGTVVPFASDIIPLGYLLCDGRTITRLQYPELYDLIGATLPDHRGVFLRGNDNGRGLDPNRLLGSYQGDAIRNITGTIATVTNANIFEPDGFIEGKKNAFGNGITEGKHFVQLDILDRATSSVNYYRSLNLDASKVVPTANENRPINNSTNYIIKALHIANPSMEYQVADDLNSKINNKIDRSEGPFTTISCPISKADNGWCKLANGMIMQWGQVHDFIGNINVNTPIAFSNSTFVLNCSLAYKDGSGLTSTAWTNNAFLSVNTGVSSFYVGTGVTTRILGLRWIAVGY
ncbi:MAG: phage tail protein [Fusobacteriaceae bacterium]